MMRRLTTTLALTAVSLATVAALGTASASAQLVKLPGGRYANFDPVMGSPAARAARIFDSAFSNLDYSGGPVMPSNTNYTVVWQPAGYSGTAFQTGYVAGVNQYFTDVAAASGSADVNDAVSTQYNDANGNTAAFRSSYGGTFTDTDALPANGCPAPSGGICITDAQIQTELDTFLAAHSLPHDLSHEYFLLTPPSVASCFDSSGDACSANAAGNQQAYCAYHSATTDGYIYANIPDLTGLDGCDPFVTQCPSETCEYPNGPADGVLSAVSHEHNESTTDPYPNSAWTDWQPGCTSSSPETCGGEVGDKCAWDAFQDPNIHLQPSGDVDTPYNETINGHHYLLQMLWSNQTHQCLDGFTAGSTTAGAAFTDSPGSGDTVDFDAGASTATGGVAEYVWQFNDGPGQTYTVETTSPSTSHTFPATGEYTVALTVMASDGTSVGTAATLDVGGASSPSASFTNSSAAPGTPVNFDATGSSDPNAGGAITSYSWSFGDGTAGSGATAAHTYATAGHYMVTLTVTDNSGLTNTVTRMLTVAGTPPTAAFSFGPSGAAVGTPVSFDGSSSRAAVGSLRTYSWTFGDGATGSGATSSHSYAAPGSYTVTLTVTDTSGDSASVSHEVTVAMPAAPVAAFTLPATAQPNHTVSFDGSGSQGSHIVTYIWSFGDGSTAAGETVSHSFAAGTYTVTLTVYDVFGQSSSVSHQIRIALPAGPPVACVVPHLAGTSLARAEHLLAGAHCRTGTVHKPRRRPRTAAGRHRHWAVVVASSSPGAGRRMAAGARVTLTLAYRSVRG